MLSNAKTQNGLFNAKISQSPRKMWYPTENILSYAKTCYLPQNLVLKAKMCYPTCQREKHAIYPAQK